MTEATRPSACKRGYGRRWQRYSKDRLGRHPLCVDPYGRHAGRPVAAVATDHIVPVNGEDDPLFYEPMNHQSLCQSCHSEKTAKEDGGFGRRRRG